MRDGRYIGYVIYASNNIRCIHIEHCIQHKTETSAIECARKNTLCDEHNTIHNTTRCKRTNHETEHTPKRNYSHTNGTQIIWPLNLYMHALSSYAYARILSIRLGWRVEFLACVYGFFLCLCFGPFSVTFFCWLVLLMLLL